MTVAPKVIEILNLNQVKATCPTCQGERLFQRNATNLFRCNLSFGYEGIHKGNQHRDYGDLDFEPPLPFEISTKKESRGAAVATFQQVPPGITTKMISQLLDKTIERVVENPYTGVKEIVAEPNPNYIGLEFRKHAKDPLQRQPVKDGKAGMRPSKVAHSPNRIQVDMWLDQGVSDREIARRLTTVERTKYNHMNVYRYRRSYRYKQGVSGATPVKRK